MKVRAESYGPRMVDADDDEMDVMDDTYKDAMDVYHRYHQHHHHHHHHHNQHCHHLVCQKAALVPSDSSRTHILDMPLIGYEHF